MLLLRDDGGEGSGEVCEKPDGSGVLSEGTVLEA